MNSIVLFKNNLRINDNPALYHAAKYSDKILPIYIYDDVNIKKSLGSASKYWLYSALNSLKKSLDRLQTDHVDLIQLHSLTHPDEWDQVFSSGGALEALVEAKEAGLARFIGVTGHGWTAAAMHLRSLKKYPFDSVLLPWNWFAAHHRNYPKEFFATLDFCESKSVAVQTIKGVARGPWGAGIEPTHSTWYQPLEDENCIKNAVHYVLSQPGLFFNSAGDINILPLVLRAAQSPIQCPSTSEMDDMAKQVGLSSIFGL